MKAFTKFLTLLLSLALCLSLFAGCAAPAEDPGASTEDTTESTEPSSEEPSDTFEPLPPLDTPANMGTAYGSNASNVLSSYGITLASPKDANMTAVVAVDAENNAILTNAQMQFFFWEEFYQMQDYYGDYYLSMLGLSAGTPLSQQVSLLEGYTWEQYFVESVTNTFSNFYALYAAAKAEGYTLSAEDQELLDYYTTPEGGFVQDIASAGYTSLEDYLAAFYGTGVDTEDYRTYLELYLTAMGYYDDVLYLPVVDALTEADVAAYYDENSAAYQEKGVLKTNNVSVRHILIQPEETDAETGDYTEAAWTAAEQKAQEVYDLWLTNPTAEYFAELANEYSTDGGSNTPGGLYEDFAPGQMVAEFNDWSFDEARQTGDHGIVKTSYGYHIMYFVEQTETRAWYDTVVAEIANTSATEALSTLRESHPVYFDYTQVRIFDIIAHLQSSVGTESE